MLNLSNSAASIRQEKRPQVTHLGFPECSSWSSTCLCLLLGFLIFLEKGEAEFSGKLSGKSLKGTFRVRLNRVNSGEDEVQLDLLGRCLKYLFLAPWPGKLIPNHSVGAKDPAGHVCSSIGNAKLTYQHPQGSVFSTTNKDLRRTAAVKSAGGIHHVM